MNRPSPERHLKIAVMGAGAVGCYYGGMLARAGHNVTLIGRFRHVQAIASAGLRLQTQTFDEQIFLQASSHSNAVGAADVVLFCVKSSDTETAGRLMQPFLSAGTTVICLQNGVDNAERLRAVLPQHQVLAAVVYVATEMAGAGHVKHNGRGDLVIENSPRSAGVVQMLLAAGVPTEVSSNVRGALWAKLILNCAYNAVSAITQLPYGKTTAGPGVQELMRDVVAECLAVAQAEGVQLVSDTYAAVACLAASMPEQTSSTAQDLALGKPSEIDYLNGYVVQRGKTHGIKTPVNQVLWALVKLLESKNAVLASVRENSN